MRELLDSSKDESEDKKQTRRCRLVGFARANESLMETLSHQILIDELNNGHFGEVRVLMKEFPALRKLYIPHVKFLYKKGLEITPSKHQFRSSNYILHGLGKVLLRESDPKVIRKAADDVLHILRYVDAVNPKSLNILYRKEDGKKVEFSNPYKYAKGLMGSNRAELRDLMVWLKARVSRTGSPRCWNWLRR